jgi:hypothetical protein
LQHHIRANQIAAGKFAVTGAVSILSTSTPVRDAALALRDAGHPESDLIAVASGDCTFVPQTIGAILRPRPAPPKFNPELQMWAR